MYTYGLIAGYWNRRAKAKRKRGRSKRIWEGTAKTKGHLRIVWKPNTIEAT